VGWTRPGRRLAQRGAPPGRRGSRQERAELGLGGTRAGASTGAGAHERVALAVGWSAQVSAVQGGHERLAERAGACAGNACAGTGAGASASRSGCGSDTGTGSAGIESPSVLGTRWAQPEGGSTAGGVGEAVGNGAGAELRARDAAARRLGADPHGENNGAAREGRRRPLRRKPRTKSSSTANCSWRTEVAWRGQ
jgi:hypothetical protein